MKVLVVTNLYPYENNPAAGIFITKRLAYYSKFGVEYKAVPLSFKDSGLLIKLARSVLQREASQPLEQVGNVSYTPVFARRDFRSVLVQKWGKKSRLVLGYAKSFATEIETSFSKDKDYDIIHAHGMYLPAPAGIVAMELSKRLRIPYVVTLHGSDINVNMADKKLRGLYLQTLEAAAKCIFVSEALLNRAKSFGYSGKNAVVISNGYDPEIFRPMDKDEVRKKLGIYKEGYKYVGFVGNLIPIKRADKLGEIFHLIKEKVPNVFFIVVGDGYLRNKLEKETKDLEIIFTGRIPQEQVAKYMNAMDVMILPSREEGFGAVIIEAQACGTCVVGSSNGGIPEAIGFKEYVVEEGESFEKRFSEKVVNVLRNGYDANQLIERAKLFTWEEIVGREIAVYIEILNSR